MGTASTACIDGAEDSTALEVDSSNGNREKFLYTVAINRGGSQDPDMLLLVGTDPDEPDKFGKVFHRVDAPNVGDEFHHMGYSFDETRLYVPGLFSGRMYVFDVTRPLNPRLTSTGNAHTGGYIIPHSVIPRPDGSVLVTMVGAATETTGPGGIIRLDPATGNFLNYFGPGPTRSEGDLGPEYMYDFDEDYAANRGISTTFGHPANVGGGISPGGLGNTVAVWDLAAQRVIQVQDLGTNSGALEVRFIHDHTISHGYINTPGTGTIWYFEDREGDGRYNFHPVVTTGLAIPVDMLLSEDHRYMYITNWFTDNVQQYDITDRFAPRLVGEGHVPHANMIRLSRDGKRLYVSNSLLSTWDDDPNFGPTRNTNYGIWAFNVDTVNGGLSSFTGDTSPWVSTDAIQKKTSVGPAGPHMMLFDAKASTPGHH